MAPRESEVTYWITPVKADETNTADEVIEDLVIHQKLYGFSQKTAARHSLKAGDWICFYVAKAGVVAHAQVTSDIENRIVEAIPDYPYVFRLGNVHANFNDPISLDYETRAKLDAFRHHDLGKRWAWIVQTTRKISKHDFDLLTSRKH
jgi:hypothetical protein